VPLVNDYQAVKDVYQEAAELGVAIPAFCAEDRETLEAVLLSALEIGAEIGVDDLPVVPAWTVRYPGRGQMTLVTRCGEPVLGTRMMLSDLEILMGETSPYCSLRVLPHLDHAFPWLDGDILEGFADDFASVMCDASERSLDENIRWTAQFVERLQGRVVIEGGVDEVFQADGVNQKNEPTTVAQARRFLSETGVDIIVPNVGTEHRATSQQVAYRSERAREISRAVGRVLCLHGTSSLRAEDLRKLTEDGFVKVNIYTTLAVHGGQAVARNVLANLGNILARSELEELAKGGVLGEKVLAAEYGETQLPIGPKLANVANPPRRDAWVQAVKHRCKHFLYALGYERYA
jgi:fructose-bisphosphate aldolase class II